MNKLELRYSPPNQVELSGTANELENLVNEISRFIHSEEKDFILKTSDSFDPSPYPERLSHIIFCSNNRSNTIFIENSKLILSGSRVLFENFAANIPWNAEDPESNIAYHVHYDAIGREFIFGSDMSMEIIITKEREKKTTV